MNIVAPWAHAACGLSLHYLAIATPFLTVLLLADQNRNSAPISTFQTLSAARPKMLPGNNTPP